MSPTSYQTAPPRGVTTTVPNHARGCERGLADAGIAADVGGGDLVGDDRDLGWATARELGAGRGHERVLARGQRQGVAAIGVGLGSGHLAVVGEGVDAGVDRPWRAWLVGPLDRTRGT